MMLVTFKVTKFTYSPTAKFNKLTKIPFISVALFTLILTACYLFGFYSVVVMTSLLMQYALLSLLCYCWSLIIILTCFEWEIITSLVVFQSQCDLNIMGVMKHKFNTVVELKIVYKYGVLIALDSLYHLLKTVWPWAITTPENIF
jgi:hypothetical protein